MAELNTALEKIESLKDDIAYLEYTIGRVKARIRGLLRKDKEFLQEAIIALTRNPPKIHVMVDHAERIITDFEQELIKLDEPD